MQRRQFLLWTLGGTTALALGVSLYVDEGIGNLSEHEKPHDLLLGALMALLQQAYLGLRELLMASYYACPEHWDRLNYNKPKLAL